MIANPPGWGNYFLLTKEAEPDSPASIAIAATCADALAALVPQARAILSARGELLLLPQGAATGYIESRFGTDWLLVALDDAGHHHVIIATRYRRPLTQAQAWERVNEIARNITTKRWAQLDELVLSSLVAVGA
jgi:hypothetical protein